MGVNGSRARHQETRVSHQPAAVTGQVPGITDRTGISGPLCCWEKSLKDVIGSEVPGAFGHISQRSVLVECG